VASKVMKKRQLINPALAAAVTLLSVCDDAPPGLCGDCMVIGPSVLVVGSRGSWGAHEDSQFTAK
jgi:hypothetical protein